MRAGNRLETRNLSEQGKTAGTRDEQAFSNLSSPTMGHSRDLSPGAPRKIPTFFSAL